MPRVERGPIVRRSPVSRSALVLIAATALVAALGPAAAAAPAAVSTTTTYEAESGTVGGGTRIDSEHRPFTGTGYANFPANGGWLQFNGVDGGTSGSAPVTIRYANGSGSARTGRLVVNGVGQSLTTPATSCWSCWDTISVTVPLTSGAGNTIRFETIGQDLANIDHIVVTSDGGTPGAPAITTQPASQTVTPGSTVTLSVQATGTQPLSYQWRHNGTNIPGATAASYTITNVQTAHAGQYTVVVSNSAGSVTSNPATLTLREAPTGPIGWASMNGGTDGGVGGSTVTVSSAAQLEDAIGGSDRRVVRVSGTISCSGMLAVGSNKSILGNSGATISGCGFNLDGSHNVIIRNLTFRAWNDDAINMQNSTTNVWVDHNTFVCCGGDGSVDIKRGSDFITVSWNRTSHNKNMLLGHADNNGSQDIGHLRVTYHHNWFDGSDSRNPRVRFGDPVHVFNNYYLDNSGYGIASTMGAGVLVENNYFENVPSPFRIGYGSSGPGDLVHRGNRFINSGSPSSRGDVNPIPYSYSLDSGDNVRSIVMAGAGAGNISP